MKFATAYYPKTKKEICLVTQTKICTIECEWLCFHTRVPFHEIAQMS